MSNVSRGDQSLELESKIGEKVGVSGDGGGYLKRNVER
jgi:hypothetical protein